MPTDPVGSYNPCFMTNLYGASWSSAWNTSIYGSPQQTGADVLCNCVGYAQGRMLQIYMEINPGYDPAAIQDHLFSMFNGDADSWISIANNNGFTVLSQPQEGTVLATGQGTGDGHVAVVERYDPGQGWLISESGYNTLPPFNLHYSLYESGGQWYSSYASQPHVDGFIVIPTAGPGPIPGHGYDRHHGHRARGRIRI